MYSFGEKLNYKLVFFRYIGRNFLIGGAKGDRTPDLLHAMQALSQLSYGPITDNNTNQKKTNKKIKNIKL